MDILPRTTAADFAGTSQNVAVLPIGSLEQHGDHLPLATDTLVACGIAEALSSRYGLRLLPPITFSCSHKHAAWNGTVSISSVTLDHVVHDIVASLRRSGTEKIVIVNGHGGNYVLSNIVQELSVEGPHAVLFPGRDDWDAARSHAGLASNGHDDMHAGELETSLLLYLEPTSVRSSYRHADHATSDRRRHLLTLGVGAYTHSGVIGRPSLADATKGRHVLDSLTESFTEYLRILCPGTEHGR